VMHSWATYSGLLTAAEIATMFEALPKIVGELVAISITDDGKVLIEFTGSLMSADDVSGPYTAVEDATSPITIDPDKATQFYKAE